VVVPSVQPFRAFRGVQSLEAMGEEENHQHLQGSMCVRAAGTSVQHRHRSVPAAWSAGAQGIASDAPRAGRHTRSRQGCTSPMDSSCGVSK
jgi:hypothetical protein